MRIKKAHTAIFAGAGDAHDFAMLGFPGNRDLASMIIQVRDSHLVARNCVQ